MEADRAVPSEELVEKAKKLGALLYLEVSAKTELASDGLENCISALAEEILTVFRDDYDTNYDNSLLSNDFKQTISMNSSKIKKKKKKKEKDSDCC